jgi:predicted nucleotidyltransferase
MKSNAKEESKVETTDGAAAETDNARLERAIAVSKQICDSKYSDAAVILLAGSIVRGEDTAYSDLDLVVVFDKLPHAHVESFYYGGFPVEAFVHDSETLHYYMTEGDRASGACVMSQMVSEGIELLGPCELSKQLKELAASVVNEGPPQLSEDTLRQMRYAITNLIDDIRQPRSREETVAVATLLYSDLANFYFRANNLWTAKGKSIPRKLKAANPELYARFCGNFEKLFARGQTADVIRLTEEMLTPCGGFLFEGARRDAPPENRKALPHDEISSEEQKRTGD